MNRYAPIRTGLTVAVALLLMAAPVWAQTRLAPQVETPPPRQAIRPPESTSRVEREEHLERWMESHSNMSLAEQQRALQSEPGFRELPSQVQQNRLNMLARLYYMNPKQRNRILNRTEALERMAPAQRQEWRDAVQRLNTIPPGRKRVIAGAILTLREMPPEQREAILNSPSYSAQFSPDERRTLRTLLMAEPYPAAAAPRPPYPPPPPAP